MSNSDPNPAFELVRFGNFDIFLYSTYIIIILTFCPVFHYGSGVSQRSDPDPANLNPGPKYRSLFVARLGRRLNAFTTGGLIVQFTFGKPQKKFFFFSGIATKRRALSLRKNNLFKALFELF